MPRRSPDGSRPRWAELCELAAAHGGYFSARQAREVGYSRQLLEYHRSQGKLERPRRGTYRLAYYPSGDHDDLIMDWLWAEKEGVFSHDTALALHGLSDILPSRRHLSVPEGWRRRRLRVPRGLVLHYGLPAEADVQWHGDVPISRPLRTLADCVDAALSPDLLQQAMRQGLVEGRFTEDQLRAKIDADEFL